MQLLIVISIISLQIKQLSISRPLKLQKVICNQQYQQVKKNHKVIFFFNIQ